MLELQLDKNLTYEKYELLSSKSRGYTPFYLEEHQYKNIEPQILQKLRTI